MGRVPYSKEVTVHWHQNNKALTACGQPWLVFWGDEEPSSYMRGKLPYGESTTTDSKVTCQTCLEARYITKREEMAAIAARIEIFGGIVKDKPEKKKQINSQVIAKRVAAVVVAELSKQKLL